MKAVELIGRQLLVEVVGTEDIIVQDITDRYPSSIRYRIVAVPGASETAEIVIQELIPKDMK